MEGEMKSKIDMYLLTVDQTLMGSMNFSFSRQVFFVCSIVFILISLRQFIKHPIFTHLKRKMYKLKR